MTIPGVTLTKSDGNTGSVRPSAIGLLAIIAGAYTGTANQVASFAKQSDAVTAYGSGPLPEDAAYVMAIAKKPVLTVKPTCSTAAALGSLDLTGVSGTSVVSDSSSAPRDYFDIVITITTGGTVGTGPINYTYSLDGGTNTSAIQALGTANSITISGTGITLALAAGTLVAGDVVKAYTTPALMNNSDLGTALEALRVTSIPFEGILVDMQANTSTIATLDTWLQAREAEGKFYYFLTNGRPKTRPAPTGETEASFLTAMTTLLGPQSSIRGGVGIDGGATPSPITQLNQWRPTALGCAARLAATEISEDPGYVAKGSIDGVQIAGPTGNPKYHDEYLYPGVDAIRGITYRTFPGKNGVFITNGNTIATGGSDYVYMQHVRIMNAGCTQAWATLTDQLGRGVGKKGKDPVTGGVYITEEDASLIEGMVNEALNPILRGQVSSFKFILSRNDDLSSNSGATLHGELQIVAKAYVKGYAVTTKYVKAISVNV